MDGVANVSRQLRRRNRISSPSQQAGRHRRARGRGDCCNPDPDRHADSEATSYYRRMGMHSNLVIAHTFATELEAEMARGALEAAGIAAIIQADTAGGMRTHIAWSGSGFRILVREEDASAAHDVLEPPPEHS